MRDTLTHILTWGRTHFLVSMSILGGVALVIGVGIYLWTAALSPEDPRAPLTTIVREDDWVRGNPQGAKATIIEYGDLACTTCSTFHNTLRQLETEHGSDIAHIFRHFPQTATHPNAEIAAHAAEAAGLQNKFFEMSDALSINQSEWIHESDPRAIFKRYAEELSMDSDQLLLDMESTRIKNRVAAAQEFADSYALKEVPVFFINGTEIPRFRTYPEFRHFILERVYTE